MTKDGTAGAPDGQREHVPTGVRSLYILDVLAKAGTPLTATDINAQLGLPKPTIHRLCKRLEQEGFLTRDIDGRRYMPGRRLRDMARGVVGFSRFTQARQAVLRRLSERVGETCNITLPNDSGMIYLDRVETRWPLRVQLPVGSLVPFHCTATGKLYLSSLPSERRAKLVRALDLKRHAANTITDPDALLVELAQIAESGVGRDNEEFVEGMVAAAAPIRDRDGRFVAGLAMHGPTQRLSMEDALAAAGLLHAAARELSDLLPAVEAQEPPATPNDAG